MASYQRSGSGVRRPFGFVNANTLEAGLSKSSGSASGAVKPISEKKSLLSRRGLITTILTAKKSGKLDRSAKDETLNLESPTKKARVHEKKSSGDSDAIFRRSSYLSEEDANAFWSDEMEELLTIKQSRPVNESRDDDSLDVEVGDLEERDSDFYEQVRDALVKEISVNDDSSSDKNFLNHGHLKEHDIDGFRLNVESPAKKARVQEKSCASDVFRPSYYLMDADSKSFWTQEMKEMLSLKPSRPVNENDEDETSLDVQVRESNELVGVDFYEQVRSALVKELSVDDTGSAERTMLLSDGRLKEHKDHGIQIGFSA
jgi:hypothetical protein